MTSAEIIAAIESQFSEAVIENEDLADHQVELNSAHWFDIATFMKNDPNLSFDQLECITGVDPGEDSQLQTRYNLHSMEYRHKIEVVISHDRWFLDRIATHILSFSKAGEVHWFEGNYSEYEKDRKKRLGKDADQPNRIRYRKLARE